MTSNKTILNPKNPEISKLNSFDSDKDVSITVTNTQKNTDNSDKH